MKESGQGLGQGRFADPRNVLDQGVPLGEERHDGEADDVVLAADDARDGTLQPKDGGLGDFGIGDGGQGEGRESAHTLFCTWQTCREFGCGRRTGIVLQGAGSENSR